MTRLEYRGATSCARKGTNEVLNLDVPHDTFSYNAAHEYPTPPRVMRRILIVDDEAGVAFTLREGLRKLPWCEIVVALSGREALELFAEQHFDLLITDYKMPDLSGVALASCVQERYPGTSIIMITAYGHDLVQGLVAAHTIQRVLHKPIRLTEIRDVALETLALQERILPAQLMAKEKG